MIKVYIAMKMTSLTPREVDWKVCYAKTLCRSFSVEATTAWDKEQSRYTKDQWDTPIYANTEELTLFSQIDKQMICDANAVIYLDGDQFSKGSEIEVWFNRFALMRPTLIVDKSSHHSLRVAESDIIVKDLLGALQVIRKRFYTRFQRILWRIMTVYNPRCMWKRILREIGGWQ